MFSTSTCPQVAFSTTSAQMSVVVTTMGEELVSEVPQLVASNPTKSMQKRQVHPHLWLGSHLRLF